MYHKRLREVSKIKNFSESDTEMAVRRTLAVWKVSFWFLDLLFSREVVAGLCLL